MLNQQKHFFEAELFCIKSILKILAKAFLKNLWQSLFSVQLHARTKIVPKFVAVTSTIWKKKDIKGGLWPYRRVVYRRVLKPSAHYDLFEILWNQTQIIPV